MKLVELLARELKEWPEGAGGASQDNDKEIRFDTPRFDFYVETLADDAGVSFGDGVIVTREEWEAERDKLMGKAEWDGNGLPPIDVTCEVEVYEQEWFKCTVVAHHEGRAVIVLANKESAHIVNASQLRAAIRTPEQIAAQEREDCAMAMIDATKKGPYTKHGISHDAALALYDAGYRKQEQSE